MRIALNSSSFLIILGFSPFFIPAFFQFPFLNQSNVILNFILFYSKLI